MLRSLEGQAGEPMRMPISPKSGGARNNPKPKSAFGFTLIEFMIALAIIGIVSAMAFVAFSSALPTIRADSAMQLLEGQLRQAREYSIDLRRNVQVTFQGTGELVTVKVCNTGDPAPCPGVDKLSDYILPYGMVYRLFPGVPDTPTPNNFGYAHDVTFGCTALPCTITFQSDGSVVGVGGATAGTVFIGIPGGPASTARAVTILLATGEIKAYRYTGAEWH